MEKRWEIRGKTLSVKPFLLMGVLNVTPDSFYDGGRYFNRDSALERAKKMVAEGVDIIDIGGESTRPGSQKISVSEEIERIVPLIKILAREMDVVLSVDTYKHQVAEQAIESGASIVNDISAFSLDRKLFDVVKGSGCGYVLMHMQGTPSDMQKNPFYQDVVSEVYGFLEEKLKWLSDRGMNLRKVVVDPGIGFGKRLEDNLAILNNLDRFAELDRPVLIGTSRKSFIGKILNDIPADERKEGSLASVVIAYTKGASIFRVHDVKETRHALTVTSSILSA